ncbi:helicase HerA-like domain-containing protein [Microvirga brassicacearum]|uniref:DUF853 family protein n=1 Tax=Microvirga brassicacearum TaxID=2580413 RepID=A0A5N3PH47_9HYPH|nr:helicase HerA-like domain-containing protein [Microvirga brassicacearum]KAB0269038.1 DUF853 family protein [Microvirga brassicacearum]
MTHIILGNGIGLPLRYANRHGLVTGATGTGKTVTLQKLAEGFSDAGVPVFAADVKGDLSGVAAAGQGRSYPVAFWDLFSDDGLPIKTSIHEMGPTILARLLDLNATQTGVLNVAFKWLDDPEAPLGGSRMMDMDCLRAVIGEMMEYREELQASHGNVTAASIGAIQRSMLTLEGQGGNVLFGEPALDVRDFLRVDQDGRGVINLLSADRLMDSPKLYGAFLLWLLLRLFEVLPEAGDLDKPKLVFFFDEAHLLFSEASPVLMETIERVVRLIRSKGVGVYFVTQHPLDVPAPILSQLGNRVQHALRAFTPRDRRAVRTAAETFRQNPAIKTQEAITEMGVGEALVSFLGEGGVPSVVERIKVDPPQAQIGPVDRFQRIAVIKADNLKPKYGVRFGERADLFASFIARLESQDTALAATRKTQESWHDAIPTAGSMPPNSPVASTNSTCPPAT